MLDEAIKRARTALGTQEFVPVGSDQLQEVADALRALVSAARVLLQKGRHLDLEPLVDASQCADDARWALAAVGGEVLGDKVARVWTHAALTCIERIEACVPAASETQEVTATALVRDGVQGRHSTKAVKRFAKSHGVDPRVKGQRCYIDGKAFERAWRQHERETNKRMDGIKAAIQADQLKRRVSRGASDVNGKGAGRTAVTARPTATRRT